MADKPAPKTSKAAAVGALTKEEKEGCSVRPCTNCPPPEYQDKKYGLGKRVKNFSTTKRIWACTVCGKYE